LKPADAPFVVGGRAWRSRLILGTGKYRSHEEMRACHVAAGVDFVTVAVRRIDLSSRAPGILDFIDRAAIALLPNTAGCYTADDAVRTARLGRESLQTDFVKLEVLGDERTLLPDPVGTLDAARVLVAEGFRVLVYTSDDVILARRLADSGVSAVMPAGSPIGSGRGVLNPLNLRFIVDLVQKTCPVIVDAGVGTASDVAAAMEMGVDGVLLNTAVAQAGDPVRMARAMKAACEAGRDAWLAGRIAKKDYGAPSSPPDGLVGKS
jgi:thiazole synthase